MAAIIALSNSLQRWWWPKAWRPRAAYGLLQANGCQYAQGYLFAPPLTQPVRRVLG